MPGRDRSGDECAPLVLGDDAVLAAGLDAEPHLAAVLAVLGRSVAQTEHGGHGGERLADLHRAQDAHRAVVQVGDGATGGVGGLADGHLHHQAGVGQRTRAVCRAASSSVGGGAVGGHIGGEAVLVAGDGAVQRVVRVGERERREGRDRATDLEVLKQGAAFVEWSHGSNTGAPGTV